MAEETAGHKGGDSRSRDHVSKKTRFEVFKRDSFTCAYCGRAAPEVVLHVDHIQPVAEGGLSDILNLITACKDCNAGKGARPLSDQSTLAKQKATLDELNERRVQLEMLVEWRASLASVEEDQVAVVSDAIAQACGDHWNVTKAGAQKIRRWLKRHSVAELLAAVDEAFVQHFDYNTDKDVELRAWNKAFDAIPKTVGYLKQRQLRPWLSDAFYVRGILRVRHENGNLDHFDYHEALALIEAAFRAGASADSMKEFAKAATVWDQFVAEIRRFCSAAPSPKPVIEMDTVGVGSTSPSDECDRQRHESQQRDDLLAREAAQKFDWPDLDEPFPELAERDRGSLRNYFEH